MDHILSKLNEQQQQAVKHTDGPLMVLAGAGSGKTRVLTHRIAYLLKMGVDAHHILSLTFTNKAAREMKERVYKLIGSNEAMNVWMGTFHSVFARILRVEAQRLGYPSNFSIYDTEDTRRLMKSIIKENNLDDKTYPANFVLNRISGAKSNLITAREYFQHAEIQSQDEAMGKPHIGKLYNLYAKRCYQAAAMDFDDLLLNMNILLRDFPEVLVKYQHKFEYILVDEYQDTNYAQYLIVKMLAANNENLCVVGDDAQSIYSFRGANIENIFNIKRDYPDVATYKLEQNYRSSNTIVQAANSIIVKNKKQFYKEIWTENQDGEKIKVFRANSDNEEGRIIASAIFNKKMDSQLLDNDFAILYRTNAQSRSFEESLRRLNIPYRIYGGLSFYKRKEIKDLLAYFQLAINHKHEEALMRIINYPARGIGKTTLEKAVIQAEQHSVSLWEIVNNPQQFGLNINQGTRTRLEAFTTMIDSFRALMKSREAYDLAKHIAHTTGLMADLYNDKTPEGLSRYENIEELLNGIKEFTESEVTTEDGEAIPRTLDVFMEDVALLTDADEKDDDTPKVSLMTIHAAKGLEFPHVYIVGLEENLFPSIQSIGTREDLEEERRLFYVALTRAEKEATLSYAESRYRYGNLTSCEPSRFIAEIDTQFMELPAPKTNQGMFLDFDDVPAGSRSRPDGKGIQPKEQLTFSNKTISPGGRYKKLTQQENLAPGAQPALEQVGDLKVGSLVAHARFGKGKIVSLEGKPPDIKATVDFAGIGKKQLLLKFAKLEMID